MPKLSFYEALQAINEGQSLSYQDVQARALRRMVADKRMRAAV